MKPILINFKSSFTLSAIVVLMSLIMSSILIPLNLYWQIKLVLVTVVALAAIYTVSRYGLLCLPSSYVALMVNAKNELQITRRDGVQLTDLSVTVDSVVTPVLTVIAYHQKNATLLNRVFCARLIILPDALDAESYRQLRVWLRWGIQRTANSN